MKKKPVKKNEVKKLTVSRETVRRLDKNNLGHAAGAVRCVSADSCSFYNC